MSPLVAAPEYSAASPRYTPPLAVFTVLRSSAETEFGERNRDMADNGPILVTGAAGQLGAVGRTVCGLLLDRGLPVRAMVRREDDRAVALRRVGAKSTRLNSSH